MAVHPRPTTGATRPEQLAPRHWGLRVAQGTGGIACLGSITDVRHSQSPWHRRLKHTRWLGCHNTFRRAPPCGRRLTHNACSACSRWGDAPRAWPPTRRRGRTDHPASVTPVELGCHESGSPSSTEARTSNPPAMMAVSNPCVLSDGFSHRQKPGDADSLGVLPSRNGSKRVWTRTCPNPVQWVRGRASVRTWPVQPARRGEPECGDAQGRCLSAPGIRARLGTRKAQPREARAVMASRACR